MKLTGKTTAELLAIRRERKFTREEREELFGEPNSHGPNNAREIELVRRLDAGLYLTKADAKEARRLKRAATE